MPGLGPQALKGISTPLAVYRVMGESGAQSRFEVAVGAWLDAIGRAEKRNSGCCSGAGTRPKKAQAKWCCSVAEPGIGKSRLVQELKEQVSAEGTIRIEFRCSAYHQNSAFYPIIEHLQRLLQFAPHDPPQAKLAKLQRHPRHLSLPTSRYSPLVGGLTLVATS